MASETVPIRRTASIFDEMQKIHDRVLSRAYEIFDGNGRIFGKDFDDWMRAERELLWKPTMEMSESDNEFVISVAVPGMDSRDLQVEVTAEDLLIKGESKHEHNEEKEKVHTCEFESGSLFRSIHFPKKINPDMVKAEFKNGMLKLTAPIAEEQRARKITFEAA